MHVLISADDSGDYLGAELARVPALKSARRVAPRIFCVEAEWPRSEPVRLVFARQLVLDAVEVAAPSISAWGQRLWETLETSWPEAAPWSLHVEPCYGAGSAGQNRCGLIREALKDRLRRQKRQRLRAWRSTPDAASPELNLVQLVLTSPETGFLSVAKAPDPFRLRADISPFPLGEIPVAVDKAAPSRAFAKLVEAELRLGRRIVPGETCVDLGASPGSWSYVALDRGARVVAVDRSPLREDLMRHPRLTFRQGDAFQFSPAAPVDWLLCDVIAAPERSIDLVLNWVRRTWARRFVVTIKFKGDTDYPKLDQLRSELVPLCEDFRLLRLCANKNEACAFGVAL